MNNDDNDINDWNIMINDDNMNNNDDNDIYIWWYDEYNEWNDE